MGIINVLICCLTLPLVLTIWCMYVRISGCHSFSSYFMCECSVYAWIIFRGRANFHEWSLSPGTSNCSWTSCREGCTKELYDCTQIRVNYKLPDNTTEGSDGEGGAVGSVEDDEESKRYERSLDKYIEDFDENGLSTSSPTGTKWYHTEDLRLYLIPPKSSESVSPTFVFERAWLYNQKQKLVIYSCNWYFTCASESFVIWHTHRCHEIIKSYSVIQLKDQQK